MNILQQIAALLGGKLTKVHEKTVANKKSIEDEVRRATEAETALDTKINTEKSRAEGAEDVLTKDLNKEIARAKAAEKVNSEAITDLDERKVDKVEGKQLSTEDYTTAEKTKLSNVGYYIAQFSPYNTGEQPEVIFTGRDPSTGVASSRVWKLPFVSDTIGGIIHPSQKLVLDNLLSGDSALSILGTPSQTWQLNLGSGPKLKNSGGVFELRNAADTAYADLTVNALTIKGNVTQEGGSFITQAETVSAKDNTILLNSGETGAGVTKGIAGVEIDRGTLPKYKFVFDESDDRFKVGSEGDLWSVMLRDNESDLTDKGILTWDATTKRAKTAFNVDDLSTKYLPLDGSKEMTGWLKAPAVQVLTNNLGPSDWDTMIDLRLYGQGMPGIPIIRYKDRLIELGYCLELGSALSEGIHYCPKDGSNIRYEMWGEHNDGANSGLDADLLDGQHGSYYAKATDLGSYIPLAGNSKDTPITGHLYTKDVFGWGLYGMKIEGADGLPRTAHIQFNANQTGAMGSEPAKSNAYTEMGSIGEVWGPNTVSQLRVGYEDNLPVLKYRNNSGDGTSIKEYNIYHEGNLDITKFALKTDLDNIDLSGYLPLSGGTMSGSIVLPKNPDEYTADTIKGLLGEPGWLTTPSEMGNHILGYQQDLILLGNEQAMVTIGAKELSQVSMGDFSTQVNGRMVMSVNTSLDIGCNGTIKIGAPSVVDANNNKYWTAGNDGSGSGLDADLLDGKQGSEYALASNLSSYLPLSAGSDKPLTGVLYAQGSVGNGPNGFSIGAVVGDPNAVTSYGIETTVSGTSFGMGADSASKAGFFWIGGNSASEKSYFATVSKAGKVMDFLNRPTFGGVGLAKLSEVPTSMAWGSITGKPSFATVATSGSYNDLSNKPSIPSVPSSLKNPYAITFTGGVTGTYDGSAAKTVAIPTTLPANGGYASELRGTYYASGGPEKPPFFNKVGLFLRMLGSGNLGVTSTYMDTLVINTYINDVPWCNALAFAKDGTARGWIVAQNPNNSDWGTKKQIVTTDMLPSIPSLSGGAGATSGQYVSGVTVSGHTVTVTKATLPSVPSLSGYATQSWVQSQGYLTSHQSLAGYVAGTKIDRTSLGALPSYSSTGIPTTSLLAYWNGAYTGTSSNLSYCSKGAFGDMCTQTASNYVNVAGAQTISGAKTFTSFVTCSAGAGTSSDIRLKKYINRMFDAEELLSNLSGYRYVMKETDMHYAGLIAQEVQEVLPEAVREDKDGFLTVDTYPIVAALVEANKAKDNRIKALEDRITALEKKMNMILNKLG